MLLARGVTSKTIPDAAFSMRKLKRCVSPGNDATPYCTPFVTKLSIAYGHHVSLHGHRLSLHSHRVSLRGERVSLHGDRVRIRV